MTADVTNSKLTQDLLSRADRIRKEQNGNYLIIDYVLLAALDLVDENNMADYGEEGNKLKQAICEYSKQKSVIRKNVLQASPEKASSMSGSVLFQKSVYSARNKAKKENSAVLTADVLLECIINENREALSELLDPSERKSVKTKPAREGGDAKQTEQERPSSETVEEEAAETPAQSMMPELVADTKRIQTILNEKILGQPHAVASFVSGYFQSALFAITDQERVQPKATFLFAGPPGVGKTFLAEEAAKAIGLPFRRFDMSEYSNQINVDQLTGLDKAIVNSSEGLLTGFVAKNPRCVILFDEIEKAHQSAIYLFLQVLDAGILRDNKTDNEVSFRETILVFTTNAGKNLYEEESTDKISSIPRKVILSALRKDVNPATGEPFFPAAICSRFASGNVVMFNRLTAYDLSTIIKRRLDKHAKELQGQLQIDVQMDERIPSILLMAEGATADARTVKSRADAFWGEELYELFRLVSSERADHEPGEIKTVQLTVNTEGSGADTEPLLTPQIIPEAIALSNLKQTLEPACDGVCRVHYAADLNKVKKLYRDRDIQFIICDAPSSADTSFLNREDAVSSSRSFLIEVLSFIKEVPVYLLEDPKDPLSEEEKISYIRRGVQGFLSADAENPEVLKNGLNDVIARALMQHNLNELARSNKVMTFETSQEIIEGQPQARIALFDFRLEVAVEAGDSQNLLSAVSRPEITFDQVIGAEEAKKELRYFVSYLQDPKRFMGYGVDMPKGIILYGPPGTGKTMLAKAMAGESGVTFIAAEGNQFFNKYVGESEASVHRIFALARKYAPSILFVDEIDAIAKARTGSEFTHAAEGVLTAFLSEMDGFSKDSRRPVFVLAATNFNVDAGNAKSLDPALMRRFDRRLFVDLPDKKGRAAFLERQTKDNPMFSISQDGIDALAERSTGMSLAQLASVIELAKRDLVREGKKFIDDAALEEAFETFNSGEKKEWSEEQTLRTARHEAGHAFLNWRNGEVPSYITIVSRGNYGGYMQHADQEGKLFYTRQELLDMICTSLGGRAAEIVYYGPQMGLSSGASGDLSQATAIARRILGTYGMDEAFGMATIEPIQGQSGEVQKLLMTETNKILREQMERAITLIGKNRASIDVLVEKLLQAGHLNGAEISGIFQQKAEND